MEREFMDNGKDLSRRSVLCGLALVTLGLLPDSAIAAGNVSVLANGKVEVSLASNPNLKKSGGVVQFQDGNGRQLALIRTGSGASAFKAIDLSCTHQGVTVNRNGSEWLCPAHGSRFALDGKLKSGKARTDLRTVAVKVSATKVVVG
jgi:Rieske Fe-S protein